ncbi:MAG: LacI family DNA-binding transcriptional regulator [Pseudomonadota bacterium]
MPRKAQTATMADVAQRANVSLMTVSRAIRGVEGISEQKRVEILKIARQLKYVPNSAARSLAVANSNLIGISLPTFAGEVFADILNGMRRTFDSAGYSSVIDTTEYNPEAELDWVRRLLSWKPAAIILTGIDHHPEVREALRSAPIPVLEIWDQADDPIDVCVGIDHRAAGRVIGQHARDCGYEKPSFVSAPRGHDVRADARLQGIRDVFEGVDVLTRRPELSDAFSTGFEGTRDLIFAAKPDVIFFLNDHMAFGGLMACQMAGASVPDDVGIVGFNGLDITGVLPIRLTTVRTPRRLMGITGARNLLARINGVTVQRSTILPIEFCPGETTRSK